MGWELQGLADFAGTGVYRTTVVLDDTAEHPTRLELPGVRCTAAVSINGTAIGDRYTAPFVFDIPDGLLRQGDNDIEIEVSNTAANRYYAGAAFHREPEPSGLTARHASCCDDVDPLRDRAGDLVEHRRLRLADGEAVVAGGQREEAMGGRQRRVLGGSAERIRRP